MSPSQHHHLINNRYLFQRTIGSGGMADIFLAKDIILERLVAIKRLHKDYSQDKSFQDRFKLEAKAAANLSHPNIVAVYDFGFDDGMPLIVMEFVSGVDLKTIIRRERVLGVSKSLNLIIQACSGLGYAHRAGLIHCDIKPENMLVSSDMRLKLTDFGIARALSSINPSEFHEVVWGSPLYFSPEQASGSAPSAASDVYSLGIVLFEMLTGTPPFQSDSSEELMLQHRQKNPPNALSLNPEIPIELDRVLEKVLSKNPANRYRTADQFGRVLISIRDQVATSKNSVHSIPDSTTPLPPPLPELKGPKTIEKVIEWELIGWSFITLLAVGGLIPFWLYVYFSLVNPIR